MRQRLFTRGKNPFPASPLTGFLNLFAREPADRDPSNDRASTAQTPSKREELHRKLLFPHWLFVLSTALYAIFAVALICYALFRANHFIISRLLQITPAEAIPFEIAIFLLALETALIITFTVQNRRRTDLEQLLSESEERVAFAAGAADIGLWAWDSVSDSFWATPHCQDMLAIPPGAEYSMAAMREAIHPDDRALVSDALERGVKSDDAFEVECRFRLGNQPPRWVRCRVRAARARDGKVLRLSGTIIDITDRKNMQTEVESQRQSLTHLVRVGMLGELSGALAHELNQPLTAIMSNAQAAQRMIKQQPIDLNELGLTIQDIISNDVRAGEVIRHLRALLKKEDLRRELLDLNDVVQETLNLTHSDLIGRRITVSFLPAPAPVTITGDAIQLQQLLLNLFMNAADAMSTDPLTGGTLVVSVAAEPDGARHIAISDTGSGVHAGMMEKLFDPFFSTKPLGLGLGLSISRSIVRAHGGELWAENNPGRGATFHVQIPDQQEVQHDAGTIHS